MTLVQIQKRIDAIRRDAGDGEMAHDGEDSLHREVLASIAAGTCEEPAKAAALALTTRDMDFARWYAA